MDRFIGTDESYLLTPISKADIVTDLIISGLFITTAVAIIVFAVSMVITDIPLFHGIKQFAYYIDYYNSHHPWLTQSDVCYSRQIQSFQGCWYIERLSECNTFFPSGAVYPIASFPQWLKTFAKINPESYAVDALKTILFQRGRSGEYCNERHFPCGFYRYNDDSCDCNF
ncbi:MAG: hypothetical protein HRF42_12900 [Candidatus Brocadia sp.]|jgi:ABC-2 type transport system permease protein